MLKRRSRPHLVLSLNSASLFCTDGDALLTAASAFNLFGATKPTTEKEGTAGKSLFLSTLSKNLKYILH